MNESHPQDARHPERVPGAEAASADDRKFREYILSETHPIGRGKAKFFKNIGYTGANWQELREQFLAQLPRVPGRYTQDGYGQGKNYEAVISVASSSGTANVRTFWEVHPENGTKFLTAYPLDSETGTKTP